MNMPTRRDQPAKKDRSETRVGCTEQVCSSEFKMLRVIRVLSVQIAVDVLRCKFSLTDLGAEPNQEFLNLTLKPELAFLCGYVNL